MLEIFLNRGREVSFILSAPECCFPLPAAEGGASPNITVGVQEVWVRGPHSLPPHRQDVSLRDFLPLLLPQPFPSSLELVSISHSKEGKKGGRGDGGREKGRKEGKIQNLPPLLFLTAIPGQPTAHPLCARRSGMFQQTKTVNIPALTEFRSGRRR